MCGKYQVEPRVFPACYISLHCLVSDILSHFRGQHEFKDAQNPEYVQSFAAIITVGNLEDQVLPYSVPLTEAFVWPSIADSTANFYFEIVKSSIKIEG